MTNKKYTVTHFNTQQRIGKVAVMFAPINLEIVILDMDDQILEFIIVSYSQLTARTLIVPSKTIVINEVLNQCKNSNHNFSEKELTIITNELIRLL